MSIKTHLLTLAILVLFSFTSTAQLEDGTVAPDFFITDINGNNHQLYPLLNQGKTVVLSFFWTIDPVSWGNHSIGYLNDVWDQRGPGGTDDYFVIGIEGVESTTIEDLNGTGSSTAGDWVTGTPYPMVNLEAGSTLVDDYSIFFYPTYYVICPQDTTVRVISPLSFDNLTLDNGCTENTTSVAEDFKKQTWSIYPNPAAEYIQFAIPEEGSEDAQIILMNAIGKTIFIGNANELENSRLPVNHLPSGIYLVTLYTAESVLSQRISVR